MRKKKLRTDVEHADILTVTVGGNDLMHVLQKNLLSISTKDVTSGATTYRRHLTSLLKALRQLNPRRRCTCSASTIRSMFIFPI